MIVLRILVVVGVVLAVGGCGEEGSSEASKNSQVVAKVNGDEITIHQVNFALSHMGQMKEAEAKEAGKEALKALVDQELLFKKAIEAKLDRDPKITQAIEAAKRQILSQSYLEKQIQGLSKPAPTEVREYYGNHPELFEKRRVYKFQELAFESKPETLKGVKEQLDQGKSLPVLAAWLKSQKIEFNVNESIKPAEQLPLELLPRVQNLKNGQIIVVPAGNAVLVLQLVASSDQPLSEDQAKPLIEGFLGNKKRMELAQAEVKKLRDAAKIEYMGAFADAGKPDISEAKDAQTQGAAAKDQAQAAVPVKSDKDFLEKGLSGLK